MVNWSHVIANLMFGLIVETIIKKKKVKKTSHSNALKYASQLDDFSCRIYLAYSSAMSYIYIAP